MADSANTYMFDQLTPKSTLINLPFGSLGVDFFYVLNHTLTCNTEGHELAFEVAKKTVNKVSCNLNDYMFMYVTDDFKLAFKHQLTREYVFIDYV